MNDALVELFNNADLVIGGGKTKYASLRRNKPKKRRRTEDDAHELLQKSAILAGARAAFNKGVKGLDTAIGKAAKTVKDAADTGTRAGIDVTEYLAGKKLAKDTAKLDNAAKTLEKAGRTTRSEINSITSSAKTASSPLDDKLLLGGGALALGVGAGAGVTAIVKGVRARRKAKKDLTVPELSKSASFVTSIMGSGGKVIDNLTGQVTKRLAPVKVTRRFVGSPTGKAVPIKASIPPNPPASASAAPLPAAARKTQPLQSVPSTNPVNSAPPLVPGKGNVGQFPAVQGPPAPPPAPPLAPGKGNVGQFPAVQGPPAAAAPTGAVVPPPAPAKKTLLERGSEAWDTLSKAWNKRQASGARKLKAEKRLAKAEEELARMRGEADAKLKVGDDEAKALSDEATKRRRRYLITGAVGVGGVGAGAIGASALSGN